MLAWIEAAEYVLWRIFFCHPSTVACPINFVVAICLVPPRRCPSQMNHVPPPNTPMRPPITLSLACRCIMVNHLYEQVSSHVTIESE
uniref:Uncharacterized protein n=1 Tax=Anopheles darlingi TaxID=43151 RepID=A0A2M4D7R9_ANODA